MSGRTRGFTIVLALLSLRPLISLAAVTAYLPSDVSVGTTLSDVTGLSVALAPNTLYFVHGEFGLVSSTTGGASLRIDNTGGAGGSGWYCASGSAGSGSTGANVCNTFGNAVNTFAFNTTGVSWVSVGSAILTGGTGGVFVVRALKSGSGTVTFRAGSFITVREVSGSGFDATDNLNDEDFTAESSTNAPTQSAVLKLLYNSNLRPCPQAHCSPTPTPTATPTVTPTATPSGSPTATPTASPTGTPSDTELENAVHQSNQFLVAVLGLCVGAFAFWRLRA